MDQVKGMNLYVLTFLGNEECASLDVHRKEGSPLVGVSVVGGLRERKKWEEMGAGLLNSNISCTNIS